MEITTNMQQGYLSDVAIRTIIGQEFIICDEVHEDALSITKNGKQHVWCNVVRVTTKKSSHIIYEQIIKFNTLNI